MRIIIMTRGHKTNNYFNNTNIIMYLPIVINRR